MVKVKTDLTGEVFGRLTVVGQAEDYIAPNGRSSARWLCKCSCDEHSYVIIHASNLKCGGTKSCGCLQREGAGERLAVIASELNTQHKHKTNIYNIEDYAYGVGWTTNTNREFYFDLEDYDKIKDYCWIEHVDSRQYHALEARDPQTGKNIRMHWVIVGKGYDHRDRNPLNNRKNNLRQASQEENTRNASKGRNNTSGYIGVGWNQQNQKWIASIRINGKETYLGSFINKQDAIRARLVAEARHYGEFAPQRDLFCEYGIEEGGTL